MSAHSDDPLLALQQAFKNKVTIIYLEDTEPTASLSQATHLVLSPYVTIPKTTATRFRKMGRTSTDPKSNPEDFYSAEALLLTWLLRDASAADYMKAIKEAGMLTGFVTVTDRKGVVEWLEGKRTDHDSIVPIGDSTRPRTPPTTTSALPPTTPGGTAVTAPTSGATKRRYVADTKDLEVVKKIKLHEVELRDRTTVLRGIKANNFSSVKTLINERLKRSRDAAKGPSAPSTPKPDPKAAARKARNMFPIIMISSSPTALITMHNVKRFLEEAVFEPSSEARARAAAEGNTKPEDVIAIYRKRSHIEAGGKETETKMKYFVVDGIEALAKFGADAWDRVVCVMTTGQAWQFRPYKWNDPGTLFHHVKGVYVAWANDPPNPKIQGWNVTELKIDQFRRHIDKSVVANFWKTLDTWTTANKAWLIP